MSGPSSPIAVGQVFDALVAFADFTRFAGWSRRIGMQATADFLMGAAELTNRIVTEAGGTVVKYIGDASLLVFPADAVDAGVVALRELSRAAAEFAAERQVDSYLSVAAHFGEVLGVELAGAPLPDVLGETVNVAAGLERRTPSRGALVISPQTFRKLTPETRRLFRRHRPPEVYVAER